MWQEVRNPGRWDPATNNKSEKLSQIHLHLTAVETVATPD